MQVSIDAQTLKNKLDRIFKHHSIHLDADEEFTVAVIKAVIDDAEEKCK